jgi:hypothetical protein
MSSASGFPSDRIPRGIESLIQAKGSFDWLTPPSFAGALTVADIPASEQNLKDRGRAWATSVWQAWAPHHQQVKVWYDMAMKDIGHGVPQGAQVRPNRRLPTPRVSSSERSKMRARRG